MILFKDKLNWKIGGGKGFKPHQDHPAWTDFPPDKFINVALFANNSTIENGCLEFGINEKTKQKYTELVKYNENGTGELDSEIEDSLTWYPAITSPKDILIFDSYIPHRSKENKTQNSRRIFYFTYNEIKYGDLYDKYLEKKRIEFPPDIERTNSNIKISGNKYNLANPME